MRIEPCVKCGSNDIALWDCNYSSFNPGGGKCRRCGFNVQGEAGCLPSPDVLINIWNSGQRKRRKQTETAEMRRDLIRHQNALEVAARQQQGACPANKGTRPRHCRESYPHCTYQGVEWRCWRLWWLEEGS